MKVQKILILSGDRQRLDVLRAFWMASRVRPTQTFESAQLTRSIHAGETSTFLPGHQFRVAASMYRIVQLSSSTTKPATCPISPSAASMLYPVTASVLRRCESVNSLPIFSAKASLEAVVEIAKPAG